MAHKQESSRAYVVGAYRFMVELQGMFVAGFSEVTGLESEIELEEVAEGGLNQYTHRLPGRVKFQPLVLKRGMTMTNDLWNWYASAMTGSIERKSGSIILYNELDEEFRRWNFYDAYPTRWAGPSLNAASSEVAFEAIELVHNGFKAR